MQTIQLLLLVTFCTVALFAISIQDTIGYQVHSWNDLRMWHQGMVKKNVNWLKIDFHFVANCANATFHPVSHPYCFVLSHDSPLSYLQQRKYFSSEDVVSFVKENLSLFKQPVAIALCFKPEGFACNDSRITQWIQLLDEFYKGINSVIESEKLPLTIILDGAGAKLQSCYVDLWKPWPKTWVETNPAKINHANKALFSNDPPYDRVAVLDEPVPSNLPVLTPSIFFDLVAAMGFGKFKNSPYPFLFWEPDAQPVIETLLDHYVRAGYAHQPGFKVAINIDPAQYNIYAGSRSQKAMNRVLLAKNATLNNPKVASLRINEQDFVFAAFTEEGQNHASVQYVQTWSNKSSDTYTLLNTPIQFGAIASISAVDDSHVLVANSTGYIISYHVDNSLNVSFGERFNLKQTTNSQITVVKSSPLWVLQSSFSNQAILVRLWDASTETLLHQAPYQAKDMVQSVKSVIISSTSTSCAFEGLLYYSTAESLLYATTICINSNHEIVLGDVAQNAFDVGSDVDAAIVMFESQPFVYQVHANGFCYNSEHHNRGAFPATCELQPTATPFVLIYNLAPLETWKQYLSMPHHSFISICTDEFAHGMYDMGKQPSVALFAKQDQLRIVTVHQGLNKDEIAQHKGGCGVPNERSNALVMDGISWPLPK